jgi:predicted transcriptional regulator
MPTRVLLSIKPPFARAILDGTKGFEFRRAIFREKHVATVVVYASSPVQEVIGEFSIGEIIEADPEQVWRQTRHAAGISKEYFDTYFSGAAMAYAIEVRRPRRYRRPLQLWEDLDVHCAPQSFCYI